MQLNLKRKGSLEGAITVFMCSLAYARLDQLLEPKHLVDHTYITVTWSNTFTSWYSLLYIRAPAFTDANL